MDQKDRLTVGAGIPNPSITPVREDGETVMVPYTWIDKTFDEVWQEELDKATEHLL